MYKMVELLYMAVVLFRGYCLQYFLGSFLESRWKSRWNGLCVAVLYAAGLYGISRIFNQVLGTGYNGYREAVWKLVLLLCILVILALCFYKAFCLITVFLAVAFQALADISKYAAVILLAKMGDSVVDVWNWCVEKGLFKSDRALMMTLNGSMLAVQIFQYLVIAMLLYISLRKIVRDFKEKDYEIHRTELMFLLIPAAAGLLICVLLRIIMITLEDNVPKMLYDRYPILVIVLPAILLLSLLSILYGVKLFQDMIYRNKEKSERVILKNQVRSMQKHLEEMERIYSEIRGMKHDMKNTLAVIGQLSVEEKGELQEYLADLNQTFNRLDMRFCTGNMVADTLLNMKYHEAVRLMPALKMYTDRLLFPQDLKIHSYDIGIILGNAVDNAIWACRKLKEKEPEADVFIRFVSIQKGNLLLLTVENSFEGRLVRKPQMEFPVTDKPDKENHGMGLANIKNTVEKYHGTMDYMVKGRVFILSMMMKNERGNEDGFWSDR
ncbi:MAG: GHKL domain-containing protein [Lachnospiraceae bacterium]|nr:GHKL domain-containing protein [Lachnospiraceae bacterium]